MMYSKNLAAAIKVNGKILREFKDVVYLPFGAEYSLYLKNLSTKRILVNIIIDGKSVNNGSGFVIDGNSTLDIERFVENLSTGNRFKFIERTQNIENHRGIGIEDGLVRIEYQFEKEYVAPKYWSNPWDHWETQQWTNNGYYGHGYGSSVFRGVKGTSLGGGGTFTASAIDRLVEPLKDISGQVSSSYHNDAGITVPGSISEQKFTSVMGFPLEDEKHVMIIKLLGQTEFNKPVSKPITVKHKPRCITCGRQNRVHAKFCTECGTSLEIIA